MSKSPTPVSGVTVSRAKSRSPKLSEPAHQAHDSLDSFREGVAAASNTMGRRRRKPRQHAGEIVEQDEALYESGMYEKHELGNRPVLETLLMGLFETVTTLWKGYPLFLFTSD